MSTSFGRGAGSALAAALLFGAATPASKHLLGTTDPTLLAGLLYLGCGLGLSLVLAARFAGGERIAAIAPRDLGWLAGAIVSGGIAAPLALLWGLTRVSAAAASLLLSLEAVFTALFAAVVFGEHVDLRVVVSLACMAVGAALVGGAGPGAGEVVGLVAVGAACLGWALDNNLTREIAAADPRFIAAAKGLVAGIVNVTAAMLFGASTPGSAVLAAALLVGALGYGASLVLFILALRSLGSARAVAYFATAPFLGAAASVVALGEPLTASLVAAGFAMAAGAVALLTERHTHVHAHEDGTVHAHPHFPDLDHRHRHD